VLFLAEVPNSVIKLSIVIKIFPPVVILRIGMGSKLVLKKLAVIYVFYWVCVKS